MADNAQRQSIEQTFLDQGADARLANISPELMLTLFVAVLLGLIFVEKHRPFLRPDKKIVRYSYFTNLSTFLFNDITLSLCGLPVLYLIAGKFAGQGLLGSLGEGQLKWLLAFLLLDLGMYAWHVFCHNCDAMWVFHKVHHSDQSLNVTTGLRYHLGELVMEVMLRAVFILITGIGVQTLLICQGLMTLFVLVHHSNTRIPAEYVLSKLFVVPSQHRVHHSILRNEHDSNYGAVFSFWDRLFGTLQQKEPVAIGLQGVEQQGFFDLLKAGLIFNNGLILGLFKPPMRTAKTVLGQESAD